MTDARDELTPEDAAEFRRFVAAGLVANPGDVVARPSDPVPPDALTELVMHMATAEYKALLFSGDARGAELLYRLMRNVRYEADQRAVENGR